MMTSGPLMSMVVSPRSAHHSANCYLKMKPILKFRRAIHTRHRSRRFLSRDLFSLVSVVAESLQRHNLGGSVYVFRNVRNLWLAAGLDAFLQAAIRRWLQTKKNEKD